MDKKIFGVFSLILAVIFFLINPVLNLTGFVIFSSNNFQTPYFYFFGLVFLIISFILFAAKDSLDAILILGAQKEEESKKRVDRAIKAYEQRGAKYFIITGGAVSGVPPEYKYASQILEKYLREANIPPSKIRADTKSQNTLDDLLNALKKFKGKKMGVVSGPGHLDRFELIERRAKEGGLMDKEIKIYRLETHETFLEKAYEVPASFLARLKLRDGIKKGKSLSKKGSILREIANYFFLPKK